MRNVEALKALAQVRLPDGEINQLGLPAEINFIADRGVGSHVYDLEGRRYIDFMLGMGPLLLGHSHPAIVHAVVKQLEKGTTYYALNEPVIRLADEICSASRCGEKIRFTSSGTEATFSAIRFAKAFTGRPKILKFEGAFHGSHDAALMSMAPARLADFPQAMPDSAGISAQTAAEVLVAPFNDLGKTLAIIDQHATDIACILIEPMQRYLSPVRGFLDGLRKVSTDNGILLIFDEVVTGFRLAYGGAQEYYGVVPDLAAYGKALGGGFPLGAVAGRADVLDLCARKHKPPARVYHGGTLSGNAVSAVAGLATLAELRKPDTYSKLYFLGEYARQGLHKHGEQVGIPMQVLGDGPILQVLFGDQKIRDYRTSMLADRRRSYAFHTKLLQEGVLVNPHGRMYISTAHTTQDLDYLIEASRRVLNAL